MWYTYVLLNLNILYRLFYLYAEVNEYTITELSITSIIKTIRDWMSYSSLICLINNVSNIAIAIHINEIITRIVEMLNWHQLLECIS